MFDLLYPGRSVTFETPLSVDEVASRLAREVMVDSGQQRFTGTVSNGRFEMMRAVRGRNSFRPVMKGRVSPGSPGARIHLHLQLHPLVLGLGVVLAVIAGTIAAIAAPAFPVVGSSPLVARVLATLVVVVLFAALASAEARSSVRLLRTVVGATPYR